MLILLLKMIRGDATDIPEERALVVVDPIEDTVAIAVDRSIFHDDEEGANKMIEEKND